MSSVFSPPPNPSDGEAYTFGNLIWNYEADNGVWNIASGTLIGTQGQPGTNGANGADGATGATGATGTGVTGATGGFVGFLYTFRHPDSATFSVGNLPPSGVIGFANTTVGGSNTNTIFISDIDQGGATNGNAIGRFDDSTDNTSDGTIFLRRTFSLTGESIFTQSASAFTNTVSGGIATKSFLGTLETAIADLPPDGSLVSLVHFRTGNRGTAGSNGSQGVTGATGAGVTGFFVDSSGILRGVFINRGASEPPIAGQTGDINLGYIKGTTGPVGGTTQQVLFVDAALAYGASGNNNLRFDGTALTFGAASSSARMAITGDNLRLGYQMEVHDGIFTTPAERSPYQDMGSISTLTINATGGSIQRYKVTPQSNFRITTGSGWHPDNTVTETIAVIIQSTNGITGEFAASILTERGSRKPVLFGVTGGIDILSIMRVKTSSGGLTMGFQVANGMTAANFSID